MIAPKIITYDEQPIPHGIECRYEMELPGRDGTAMRLKQFMRKLDLGDTYTVLTHIARGPEPAVTVLTTGTKGPVNGDFRLDQVEITTLGPDGTIVKLPSQEVRVRLNNPYAGLSPEKAIQRVVQDMPDMPTPSCAR